MNFTLQFDMGRSYAEYLAEYASPGDLRIWTEIYQSTELTDDQLSTLRSFRRKMKVLCVCGTWCPDCSAQCPGMQKFAEACPQIDLRFIDRDEFTSTTEELTLCGGQRVPMTIFLSEDDYFCGVYGDRSLTRYRQLASLAATSPCGKTPDQMIVQEWLNEFERIQLMLATSPRLQSAAGR